MSWSSNSSPERAGIMRHRSLHNVSLTQCMCAGSYDATRLGRAFWASPSLSSPRTDDIHHLLHSILTLLRFNFIQNHSIMAKPSAVILVADGSEEIEFATVFAGEWRLVFAFATTALNHLGASSFELTQVHCSSCKGWLQCSYHSCAPCRYATKSMGGVCKTCFNKQRSRLMTSRPCQTIKRPQDHPRSRWVCQ